jgi:ring-1,2-phenylacetyl-CoA epoxidase subunit PaaD
VDELSAATVLEALRDVKDPEIPVVSIVDLGIVQDVVVHGLTVTVAITPTFTGCPALELMRTEIRDRVLAAGATRVDVPVVLDPPWSTDRISPEGRAAMRAIGIAPPVRSSQAPGAAAATPFVADVSLPLSVQSQSQVGATPCPWCGSADTAVESPFGPTICRSIHYCHACRQSFEQFKELSLS